MVFKIRFVIFLGENYFESLVEAKLLLLYSIEKESLLWKKTKICFNLIYNKFSSKQIIILACLGSKINSHKYCSYCFEVQWIVNDFICIYLKYMEI